MSHSSALLVAGSFFFSACLPNASAPAPSAAPTSSDSTLDPAADAASPVPVEVWAEDHLEGRRRWEALPSLPVLVVSGLIAPPPDDAVLLLEGPPDAGLLDDLRALPLRRSTRERIVPCRSEWTSPALRLTPLDRLERGARLTVALAPWLPRAAPLLLEAQVAEDAEAGARARASWPADGMQSVPPARIPLVVRFDGAVRLDALARAPALALRADGTEQSGAVEEVPCADVGWENGWCLAFVPDAALPSNAELSLLVASELRDATGAPVGPWESRFRTTAVDDDQPPTVLPGDACPLDATRPRDGVCALADDRSITLTFSTNEPVVASLTAGGVRQRAVAPRGALRFVLEGLSPALELTGALTLLDLSGGETRFDVGLTTTPPLAPLSITEVRANPEGREPAQELVEVLNFGAVPVSLEGIALSDRADAVGDVIVSAFVLGPGERVLLVPDDFASDDASGDVPVPPGVPLVRIGRSLAAAGLANAGEALYLRDRQSRRLSAVPATVVTEGDCLFRADASRPRTGAMDAFATGPCTPGHAP